MKRRRNIITVAVDSPAAAGAGTQAKLISKEYNLMYLDTGKLYRLIGKLKIKFGRKFNYNLVENKVRKIRRKELFHKSLLTDKVALSAANIARDKKIRKIVKNYQLSCAYNPPKKFSGSVLDGRDITSVIMKDAKFKFYITANLKTRARRRFLEYKKLNKNTSYKDVLKSLRNRDKFDKNREHSPLKKTEDSILINTTKLSKKSCFKKIKSIMDKKLNT